MNKDEIFVKEYPTNGDKLTLVEHDGKPWIKWSTFVNKEAFGGFPAVASLPAMAEGANLNLGVDFLKAPAPRSDGKVYPSWLASREAIAKILMARDHDKAHGIFKEIGLAVDTFTEEIKFNQGLPSSGASNTESSPPTPPQDDDQDKVEDAPELEVVPEMEASPHQELVEPTIKELSDQMDESMEALVAGMNGAVLGLSKRIDDLEMVKYADQLGDMAERMSNFDERLYEFKAELADFRLVLRSVKEATGSQIQSESINKLIEMVDKLSNS